jgi:NADH-quinone oxidoreductase subunit E
MSIFPIPDELLPDTKKLEEMNKELSALMPKEFAGAVNLMVHPVAGIAAVSALGLGAASHAFGIWMGAVAGAAEVSQRMFLPFLDEATPDDFRDKTKTPVKQARAAADTLTADARAVARETAKVATEIVDAAIKDVKDAMKPAAKATPTLVKPVSAKMAKPAPVEEPKPTVARTTAQKTAETIEKIAETPAERVAPAIVETAADLMPEDFRQPKAIAKPKSPDDLKLISGVGPKLETVLNGLGVWTYGQIAALTREEIAWLDDYLGFKGRIGRDGWIEQAAELAKKTKQAGKPAKSVH